MKKVLLTLTGIGIGLALWASVVFQNGELVSALKSGDAEKVAAFFDTYVDFKLPAKEEVANLGKTQAMAALNDFYKQNDLGGFEMSSQRELNGTYYLSGRIKSPARYYQLTIIAKRRGNQYGIISLRLS